MGRVAKSPVLKAVCIGLVQRPTLGGNGVVCGVGCIASKGCVFCVFSPDDMLAENFELLRFAKNAALRGDSNFLGHIF